LHGHGTANDFGEVGVEVFEDAAVFESTKGVETWEVEDVLGEVFGDFDVLKAAFGRGEGDGACVRQGFFFLDASMWFHGESEFDVGEVDGDPGFFAAFDGEDGAEAVGYGAVFEGGELAAGEDDDLGAIKSAAVEVGDAAVGVDGGDEAGLLLVLGFHGAGNVLSEVFPDVFGRF